MVQVNLTASTSLHSVAEFENLIIKQQDGAIIRLKDVANVTLGADDYETSVSFDGNKAVYIGLQVAPSANLLEVIEQGAKSFSGYSSPIADGNRAAKSSTTRQNLLTALSMRLSIPWSKLY